MRYYIISALMVFGLLGCDRKCEIQPHELRINFSQDTIESMIIISENKDSFVIKKEYTCDKGLIISYHSQFFNKKYFFAHRVNKYNDDFVELVESSDIYVEPIDSMHYNVLTITFHRSENATQYKFQSVTILTNPKVFKDNIETEYLDKCRAFKILKNWGL